MGERIKAGVEGVGLGALCHGIGWLFLVLGGFQPTGSQHVASAVLWCGSYALAGLCLGSPAWRSAFVAVLPVLLATLVALRAGGEGFLLVAAAWAGIVGLSRGSHVWLAALAGSIAGHGLFQFYLDGYHGRETEPLALLGLLGTVGLGAVFLVLGHRRFNLRPLRLPGAAFAIASLVLPMAFVPTVEVPRPDDRLAAADASPLVLIVLDTLRADHLSIHGYPNVTMPALRRFATSEAIVVDRSLANAPASLPTHASLFTGLFPPKHGANYPSILHESPPTAYPLSPGIPTLADLVRAKGYWAVGSAANYATFDAQWGLHAGFDHLNVAGPDKTKRRLLWSMAFVRRKAASGADGIVRFVDALWPFRESEFFEEGPPYRRANEIVDEGIQLVDAAGDHPFFLFLNFFDPHAPLLPPAAYRDRPPNRIGEGDFAAFERAMNEGARAATAAERADIDALYDAELAFLDVHLARLLDRLRAHPRWNEMLVVITSDHGESLGEHRAVGHALTLYDSELWVPLLLKPPAGNPTLAAPARWQGPFQSVDVFATIADHAGVDVAVDGAAWGRGRETSRAWAGVWLSTLGFTDRFARNLQAVERNGWKLIREQRANTTSSELYSIGSDAGERTNLVLAEPGRLASFEADLQADIPLPDYVLPEESEETLDRLRALGYVD